MAVEQEFFHEIPVGLGHGSNHDNQRVKIGDIRSDHTIFAWVNAFDNAVLRLHVIPDVYFEIPFHLSANGTSLQLVSALDEKRSANRFHNLTFNLFLPPF